MSLDRFPDNVEIDNLWKRDSPLTTSESMESVGDDAASALVSWYRQRLNAEEKTDVDEPKSERAKEDSKITESKTSTVSTESVTTRMANPRLLPA